MGLVEFVLVVAFEEFGDLVESGNPGEFEALEEFGGVWGSSGST